MTICRIELEMAMVAWIRAVDPCLNDLSPLEVCWLIRLAMACAFVHVVDEGDETSDKRANHLTPELKEAVSGFELYEHGCCGGQRRQRAAMWRHLYGLNNDDAHDYEGNYCAARSFAETTDKEKLKVARVYAMAKTGILKGPFPPFPQTKEIPELELMEGQKPKRSPKPNLPFRKFCLRTPTNNLLLPHQAFFDGEHDNEKHDNSPAVTT